MNDVIISSFNSYYNHSKYCELEKKMMPDRYDHPKVCNFIEKIGIDFTQMHTNTFKVNNVSNKANVTYNGPGVLDIIVELKGSVNDLPYNPEWKRMTDVFLRYVEDFLPLVGYRLMDFLGVRVLYLDGETFLIEKTAYLFMTTEIYSARELSDNSNWEVDYVFEEINRIKEMMGLIVESNDMDISPSDNNDLCDELTVSSVDELLSKLRGMNIPKEDKHRINNIIKKMKKETELLGSDLDISNTYLRHIQNMLCTYSKEDLQNLDELKTVNESKMSDIDLEGYKHKVVDEGNNECVAILDRFPEEFQREIVDELPNGSEDEINTIKNWELDPSHPIEMNLLNLLQTDSVKEAIGRTPRHVMEMIKTNPRYRLELEDVEHVSDIEVGREYGLKSGEIFDQNPKRYEEYANYDPKTAEPSTIVNGELWWGTGRLIAALLRGDMTIKVWAVTDFTTNRP